MSEEQRADEDRKSATEARFYAAKAAIKTSKADLLVAKNRLKQAKALKHRKNKATAEEEDSNTQPTILEAAVIKTQSAEDSAKSSEKNCYIETIGAPFFVPGSRIVKATITCIKFTNTKDTDKTHKVNLAITVNELISNSNSNDENVLSLPVDKNFKRVLDSAIAKIRSNKANHEYTKVFIEVNASIAKAGDDVAKATEILTAVKNRPTEEKNFILATYIEFVAIVGTHKLVFDAVNCDLETLQNVSAEDWNSVLDSVRHFLGAFTTKDEKAFKFYNVLLSQANRFAIAKPATKQAPSPKQEHKRTSSTKPKKDNRRTREEQKHGLLETPRNSADNHRAKHINKNKERGEGGAFKPFPGLGTSAAERAWLEEKVLLAKFPGRWCEACFFRDHDDAKPYSHATARCNLYHATSPYENKK